MFEGTLRSDGGGRVTDGVGEELDWCAGSVRIRSVHRVDGEEVWLAGA